MLERLKARYEQYEQDMKKVLAKASPADGLFGMGNDPKAHPCHDYFYEDVESWVAEFQATDPSREDVNQAVEWIVMAADAHRNTPVYWYMYAAQQLAAPLIEKMDPQRCEALVRWYDHAHKKLERMPAQQRLYKLLRKHAKGR